MILIGHELIDSEKFYMVGNDSDIALTPSNSTVLFTFKSCKKGLCKYCIQNDINFALFVSEIKEVVFANALGANYIVCKKKKLSKKAQKIAESYLFDSKILYLGEEKDIKWALKCSLDGILFKKGIENGSN